ncbi:hypothetical protein M3Y98_00673200 [Aphelenchoides besseyi]|nr:hypothetical protein M3Y98_00673200 [Aphelenchoides besseyi]
MSNDSIRRLISEASYLVQSDSSTAIHVKSLDERFKELNKDDVDKLSELRFHLYIIEHELQSRANRVIEKSNTMHERPSHSVRQKQTKWLEEQTLLLEHEIYELSNEIRRNERRRYSRNKTALREKQLTRFLVMKRELEHLLEANDRLKISKPRTPVVMPKNERDTLLYNFERLQKSLATVEKLSKGSEELNSNIVELKLLTDEFIDTVVLSTASSASQPRTARLCPNSPTRLSPPKYSSTDSSVNMPLFIPNSSIHTIVGGMDHSLRPNYFVFDEVVFVNKDYVISLPCHRGHSSKGCNPTKWSDIIAPEDLSEEQKEFIDRNCFEETNRHCVQERDNSNEPTGQIVMLPEPVIAHSFGMSVYVKQVDGDHYVIFPYLSTAPSALRAFEFVEGDFHYFSKDYYHALFKFPLIQRSDKFFSRKFQAGYQQPTVWRKGESTTENATTEVTTSTPRSDVCILRSQVEEKTCRPVPRVFQKKARKSLTEDDRFVGAVVGSIILAGIIVGVIAILWVWRKCPMKPKRLPDIPITYRSDNEDV